MPMGRQAKVCGLMTTAGGGGTEGPSRRGNYPGLEVSQVRDGDSTPIPGG